MQTISGLAPVYTLAGDHGLSGEKGDYIQTEHSAALALAAGTIALTFTADTVEGRQGLFSKDGRGYDEGGHLTAWIKNGELLIRQQSDDKSEHLKVKDIDLKAGTTYHLAVSFGQDGLQVYLNGQLVAAEPEFKQGLELNDRAFVVGASGSHRSEDGQNARNTFEGTISDVMVFDSQLSTDGMAGLAGAADPAFGAAAAAAAVQADLMPAFQQLHHGSDEIKALAMEYGFTHHGMLTTGATLTQGASDAGETLEGTAEADAILAGLGNDTLNGNGGNDILQGSYGNDDLNGGDGNDVLDGGHGEDILDGGAGNDFLISQADGREGPVAYDPDRDEGDPYNELTNDKLYPDQPIPADDILTGGLGADVFYFQTLINAKKRFIEEHTKDDGTIRWHGVAGENENIHDHWVDVIGDDIITDFSKAEGDRIIIEGHTTEIRSITYGDENGDGIVDHSLISLYSNQGRGGGAHANDDLGTIKVFGDLVTEADISTTAKPAYGIVNSIADLEEALKPITNGSERPGTPLNLDLPSASDLTLPQGLTPVFAIAGDHALSGEKGDYLQTDHNSALALAAGTIALTFTADTVEGRQGLFSKDGRGYDEGGHLTAWIKNGELLIRQQSDDKSEHLKVKDIDLKAGTTYHLAVSFGQDGLQVYLNGQLVAAEPEFKQGLELNDRAFVVGASGSHRSEDGQNARNTFEGTISDVMVFDSQLSTDGMAGLAGAADPAFGAAAAAAAVQADLMPAFQQLHHGSDEIKALAMEYGFTHHGMLTTGATLTQGTSDAGETLEGTAEADAILAGLGNDTLNGNGGNDILQGSYGNDDLNGGDGNDVLDGGHGEDILDGGAGNDFLISQADGREGPVAYDPDRDEGDPYNELTNGKLYPDQPIPADDILTGGLGADVFYFQTLINAKKRFIEEHTKDDGTIRWHGVAGENENIHDHWVDVIGDDIITDFSKAGGDRIIIEGHTTEIRSITYGDENGDGIVDHSLISLYSNQGNGGGAHANDDLGTIKVFGDLVTEADISTTAKPAYGIVNSIEDLDEALQPITNGSARPDTPLTLDLPSASDLTLPQGLTPVFAIAGDLEMDGKRGSEFATAHTDGMALDEGTIAFSFKADEITGRDALFSKDAKSYVDGGHLTAWVKSNGDVHIRFQTSEKSYWLKAEDVVSAGTEHHFAFSFGDHGAILYIDGTEVARNDALTQNWLANREVLVIGANDYTSQTGELGRTRDHFDGVISNFAVLDQQLTGLGAQALADIDAIV